MMLHLTCDAKGSKSITHLCHCQNQLPGPSSRPLSRIFSPTPAGWGRIRLIFRLAWFFSAEFRLTNLRLIFRLSRIFASGKFMLFIYTSAYKCTNFSSGIILIHSDNMSNGLKSSIIQSTHNILKHTSCKIRVRMFCFNIMSAVTWCMVCLAFNVLFACGAHVFGFNSVSYT